MKQTIAVLALIGQASAVKLAKEVYFASADDFDEPSTLYTNMAQGKSVAFEDVDDFGEDKVEAKADAGSLVQSSENSKPSAETGKIVDVMEDFKKLGKKIE